MNRICSPRFAAAVCLLTLGWLVAAASTGAAPRVRNVLIVSLDGFRPDGISLKRTPTLVRLLARGAGTLRARTVLPSVTLVGHTSMLTGVEPEVHGFTWNGETRLRPLRVPTIFKMAAREGLSCGMVVCKKRFFQLVSDGEETEILHPGWTAGKIVSVAIPYLKEKQPRLCLVHLTDADSSGHKHGFMSQEYLKALTRTDQELGRLLKGLDAAGMADDTLVIVTADHGGKGKRHGRGIDEDVLIPWIVSGPGVKRRHSIDRDVSVKDTAATALWVLGLPVPDRMTGRPVIEAFAK